MKNRQIMAVLLAILLAVSGCVPANSMSAFAAESPESVEQSADAETAPAEETVAAEETAPAEEVEATSEVEEVAANPEEELEAEAETAAEPETESEPEAAEESETEPETTEITEDDPETVSVSDTEEVSEQEDAETVNAVQIADPVQEDLTAEPAQEEVQEAEEIEIIYSEGVTDESARKAMDASTGTISADDLLSLPVIATDVSTASSGCVLVGVVGQYYSTPDTALARINEIRKEACEEGVTNPNTGEPLTEDDYVPIKWSGDLEYIARIRAAESAFSGGHARTSGKSIWGLISPNGVDSSGEVIAWNFGTSMVAGVNQWYEEKYDWVNRTGGVTGHYTQMIDPTHLYVGLGTFCSEDACFYNTTAGEYASYSSLDETPMSFTGKCVQMLEMEADTLSAEGEIIGDLKGAIGDTSKHCLKTTANIEFQIYGVSFDITAYLMDDVNWSSSDTGVATISTDGEITAVGNGVTTISAVSADGTVTAEAEYYVKDIGGSDISLSPTSYTYDGTAKEPAVSITYDQAALTEGTDYSLTYSNNTNAGTATVTVTGEGDYSGTVVKEFVINKAAQDLAVDQSEVTIEKDSTAMITVTGNQSQPTFKSSDEDVAAVDENGEITGIGRGTATITVTSPATENYEETAVSVEVTVTAISISKAEATASDSVYDGTAIVPAVTVVYNGTTLKEDVDYKVTVDSNTDVGSYTATIEGIEEFKGTAAVPYSIVKADQVITAEDLSLQPYKQGKIVVSGAQGALTYSSSDEAVATVAADGTVTAVAAGTAKITVNAEETNNYNAAGAGLTVEVKAYDLTSRQCTTELEQDEFVYDGEEKKPAVSSVKFGDVVLTEGKDYTVSYDNNINAGSGKVVITGNEKTTTNSRAMAFTIGKASQDMSVDRTQVTMEMDTTETVNVSGNVTEVTFTSSNEDVATVDENGEITGISVGTAVITAATAGDANYEGAELTVDVTVTQISISRAEITASDEVYDGSAKEPAITAVYNGKTLTEGTDYTVTCDSNVNAGTYSATVSGTGDFKGTKDVSYSIQKADQVITAEDLSLQPYEQGKIVVSGAQGALTYSSSDEAVATVAADGTVTAGAAGSAKITASAAETDNYNAASAELTVTVKAYDLASQSTVELQEGEFAYDGEEKKPAVTSVKVGDVTLTEDKDYTVSYENNINVGTGKVVITGNGKTTVNSASAEFTIVKGEQVLTFDEEFKVAVGKTQTFELPSAEGEVTVSAEDSEFAEFEISEESITVKGLKVGTVKVTLTAAETDNYKAAEKELELNVIPGKTTRGDLFNLANNIKITWKAVPGAKYYKVYRNGVKDPVVVTTALVGWDTCTSPALQPGTMYSYKIVASTTGKGDSSGDSPLSYSKKIYRLKTTAFKYIKNIAAGKVRISYRKSEYGDSYVLLYSDNKEMKNAKSKVIYGADTTVVDLGGFKKGKTYYFQIRVRKSIAGYSLPFYTTFGVVKSVKITQ